MSHDKENRKHLQCIMDEGAVAATNTKNTKRKLEDANGIVRKRQVRRALGDITPSVLSRENRDDPISALQREALERKRITETRKERALKRARIAEEKKKRYLRIAEQTAKKTGGEEENSTSTKKDGRGKTN